MNREQRGRGEQPRPEISEENMKKFYVISFEGGAEKYGEFYTYSDAVNYAESLSEVYGDFTVSEYDSEESYFESV